MRRLDRYDYMGLALVALLAAMWIAHFVLPPLPPEPPVPGVPQIGSGLVLPSIGGPPGVR